MNTPSDAMYIEKGYYNIDPNFIVHKAAATGIGDYYNHNGNPPVNNNPNSNSGVYSTKLYQQNAQTNKIGLGMTLKVMAGDQLNIWGRSYWFTAGGNFSDNQKQLIPAASLVDAFANTPAIAAKGVSAVAIGTTELLDALNNIFLPHTGNLFDNRPWAYINWVFFDERFNYAGGGFDRIGTSGTVKDHNNSTIPNIIVPKNGYVFVYCSNESNYNVFFDNLQVVHTRGALLEETHYYPFGLQQAGISSKALDFGGAENKYKYNGIEFEGDINLNMYDAQLRELDPQIGRWWEVDPKTEKMENWSVYASNYNNPIRYYDYLGDEGNGCCKGLSDAFNWVVSKLDKVGESKPVVWINSNLNFLVPFVEVITGKSNESFYTEDKSRVVSSMEGVLVLIPGAKAESKMLTRTAESLANSAEKNAAKGIASFTKSNFRDNLIKATGLNPGKASHAHHIFPQKFESIFSSKGINIHDPKFGSWWETTSHLKNASDYNAAWQNFLTTNPSLSQIMNYGRQLMEQYGMAVSF